MMRRERHTVLDPLALLSEVTPADYADYVEVSHPSGLAFTDADPEADQHRVLAEADPVDAAEQRQVVPVDDELRAEPVTWSQYLVDPAHHPD